MKKTLIILVSILVLISPKLVDALSLSKDTAELEVGKTLKLEVKDLEDGQTVTWLSENGDIASVSDDGTVTAIKEGNATIKATVKKTGEADQPFTATITVKAASAQTPTETQKEIDYSLKNITITGGSLDKTFSSKTKEYTVNVTDKDKFKINATVTDSENSNIIIGSYNEVKNGKVVKIVVTDKNGNPKTTYELTLAVAQANTNLATLKVENFAFNEAFDKDKTEYTVTVPYGVEEIEITAKAEDSNAKVTGTGTKTQLEVGGNQFSIKVTNDGVSKTYKIFVTREEEAPTKTKTTSSVKRTSRTSSELDIPDVEDPDSPISIIIITFGSFVLFAVGGFGIYFYIKTSPKKLKKEVVKLRKNQEASPIVEINEEEKTKEFKEE